jgi:hypothetical protein
VPRALTPAAATPELDRLYVTFNKRFARLDPEFRPTISSYTCVVPYPVEFLLITPFTRHGMARAAVKR